MISFSLNVTILCSHDSCPARFPWKYEPESLRNFDYEQDVRNIARGAGWSSVSTEEVIFKELEKTRKVTRDYCPEHKSKNSII